MEDGKELQPENAHSLPVAFVEGERNIIDIVDGGGV